MSVHVVEDVVESMDALGVDLGVPWEEEEEGAWLEAWLFFPLLDAGRDDDDDRPKMV